MESETICNQVIIEVLKCCFDDRKKSMSKNKLILFEGQLIIQKMSSNHPNQYGENGISI